MAQRLEIIASEMKVYPDEYGSFKVDMRVDNDEYNSVLGNYGYDEIVDYCGTSNLLEAMKPERVALYLRECGYKVEEEEA